MPAWGDPLYQVLVDALEEGGVSHITLALNAAAVRSVGDIPQRAHSAVVHCVHEGAALLVKLILIQAVGLLLGDIMHTHEVLYSLIHWGLPQEVDSPPPYLVD